MPLTDELLDKIEDMQFKLDEFKLRLFYSHELDPYSLIRDMTKIEDDFRSMEKSFTTLCRDLLTKTR